MPRSPRFGRRSGIVVVLGDGTRVAGEIVSGGDWSPTQHRDLAFDVAGVSLRDDGHVVVDQFGLAAPGIWALGDCSSPFELKHVANAEARTIAHNLAHPDDLRRLPHDWVPSAVFSDPQIASVGARSQDLEEDRSWKPPRSTATSPTGGPSRTTAVSASCTPTPRPAALGAHILGYQAALLITPLIQAVAHGQRVADLARGQYWIHPALSELVENALLKLPVDQRVRSARPTDAAPRRPAQPLGCRIALGGCWRRLSQPTGPAALIPRVVPLSGW